MPSMAGRGNAESGTHFVVFSTSWLSCWLLPSLYVLVEQATSGTWWSLKDPVPSCRKLSLLMFELVKGGIVMTFSQLFFSSELCKCMSRCSNLRDHQSGSVPTENRGHMTTGRWCLLTHGHLASTFAVLWAQPPTVKGKWLLRFKKSYFVTHSNDQYQLAEFLNTFQAGCSACRHSAPDLKPFLQEGKMQISTATFSMLIEVALWRKTLFAWKLQANGSVHNMQRCFKILWGCFPLLVCQLLSQGRNSVIQLLR